MQLQTNTIETTIKFDVTLRGISTEGGGTKTEVLVNVSDDGGGAALWSATKFCERVYEMRAL
jgi:hypothetical protein